MDTAIKVYRPKNNIRVVTATSLFDGHDASINIIRRILQDTGVEVIHLGHNRSVQEIVDAAIQEDVQGIAVSSYQGGHLEFFSYMVDLLRDGGASHINVFGGGGGVIVPDEIKQLEAYGVAKIFTPQDGADWGLQSIINHMVERMDFSTVNKQDIDVDGLSSADKYRVANLITAIEQAESGRTSGLQQLRLQLTRNIDRRKPPIIGITGTGGAGKSSLIDELIRRFLRDFEEAEVAVLCCDPSRKKTGGALLGDRIRMNAINDPRVYMRSLATRTSRTEIPNALPEISSLLCRAGFDLIIIETSGIGQGDSTIADQVDVAVYVMTGEFGAASQLEKIAMLDYADIVVVNKYEKQGGKDALRDVRKQVQRNRKAFDTPPEAMPVFGTIASRFNDDGVTSLYHALLDALAAKTGTPFNSHLPKPEGKVSTDKTIIIPPKRTRYLSEIADTVRKYHKDTEAQAEAVRKVWHLKESADIIGGKKRQGNTDDIQLQMQKAIAEAEKSVANDTSTLLNTWEDIKASYEGDEFVYRIGDREMKVPLYRMSLSQTKIPKIIIPEFEDPGERYRFLRREHLPGYFPYTAGVFPIKRIDEHPTRMFAGEGGPARTNRRFKLLSAGDKAKRLSTAFDSVTLYGCNPDKRPDIYGKVGTSGVSICSLDDIKLLYDGFDLGNPDTSVSMTINGPAPIILAMFLNAAIDQQLDGFRAKHGRKPDADALETIRSTVLSTVRGTVQADILKEDQGQNTCIFSTEFALKMMGDIQEFFIENDVRHFYSVSISGYHIAEAGANPVTQLAFTLANGFTYVEYYLARGMSTDDFAPNFSFFFSNGMDIEYTVIGRVARRIWSIAMKHLYEGNLRSQMLKYHVQTSGRSLHSQDIQLNDIRTTLQALCAVYDNCNSLHTNAYDEAITTPGPESVRRALAIQLIINKEWGPANNENTNQGSFIVDELTGLVEEAVLVEFDRLTQRGGVLGAMETGYQRSKIQEESIQYETLKDSGGIPIIGVNTFRNPDASIEATAAGVDLIRASEEEKESQLKRLADFKSRHKKDAPDALKRLQKIALTGENIFAELMNTVRACSLEDITEALYQVGGQYRRSM